MRDVEVAATRGVTRQGPPALLHELPGHPFDVMARQLSVPTAAEDLPGVDIDAIHYKRGLVNKP